MLISDMLRNVDWDACRPFQTAGGEQCFGIICEDKDDLLTVLSEAIDFYYEQEGCSDTRVIKLLLSGEQTHDETSFTMVWPTVPWDDPWQTGGRTVQCKICKAEVNGVCMNCDAEVVRCDNMADAQYAEDMRLMEEEGV